MNQDRIQFFKSSLSNDHPILQGTFQSYQKLHKKITHEPTFILVNKCSIKFNSECLDLY